VAFGLLQLLTGATPLDYLGLENDFGLAAKLSGEFNPLEALTILAEPFRTQPVLLAQPVIWLAAALPAALLIRRRNLMIDLTGLALAGAMLAGGYFALPSLVSGYELPVAAFLKTFVLCVIIQVGLLLISPRSRIQPLPPA
jgi:hypothetical protein